MLSSGNRNSGATAAVMIALLFAKPLYSATTATASSGAVVSQAIADREPAIETVSIVASPTIEANSQFFFGTVTEATDITPNDQSPRCWP